MHDGGSGTRLSRAEIDAMVDEIIRAEDGRVDPAASSTPWPTAAASSTGSDVAGPSRLRTLLRRVGAGVSVLLVVCAGLAVARWWPHYSDGGLPTRPTVYTDGSYAFFYSQPSEPAAPVGFDPCATIGVEINYAGATPTIEADVKRVIASIDQVSGLDLRYVGATSRVGAAPANHILVSFGDPATVVHLTDQMIGIGGIWTVSSSGGGYTYLTSSYVALNVDQYNQASHDSQLLALTRQLGHAVGLANISGHELMNSDQHQGVRHFEHGDLTGLAKLGQLPCRTGSAG